MPEIKLFMNIVN